MRRAGNLYDRIWTRENLLLAYAGAAKGKRAAEAVRRFGLDLDANLRAIADSLRAESPGFGDYRRFTVREPKERVICAASFRERVIHHAIVNVCGPMLERPLIHDTYACRRGKGQFAALARAQFFSRRQPFFLKMDVRRYFDSIDHRVLLHLLERLFKDRRVLGLFRQLLASYETAPGKGLPIGNLTSQCFANLYLSPLDHALLEPLQGGARLGGCVRYMDDMLAFGERTAVKEALAVAETFLDHELRLALKGRGFVNRSARGVEFLGFRVFGDRLRFGRRGKRRFARKLARLDGLFAAGAVDEDIYQARATALFSFVQHGDTLAFRKQVLGRGQNRLEPAETGGQLEQRRAELSGGQPQQQQPLEPQQQQRLSAGFLPGSSTRPSDQRSLNRPLSGSRASGTKTPAAAGLVALANGLRAAPPPSTTEGSLE